MEHLNYFLIGPMKENWLAGDICICDFFFLTMIGFIANCISSNVKAWPFCKVETPMNFNHKMKKKKKKNFMLFLAGRDAGCSSTSSILIKIRFYGDGIFVKFIIT